MKIKFIKLFYISILSFFVSINIANALSVDNNINENIDLKISKKRLEMVKKMQLNDADVLIGYSKKSIATTVKYDNFDNVISVQEKEITEAEENLLENNKNVHILEDGQLHVVNSLVSAQANYVRYETNSKEVAIYYVREGGKYAIHVSNTWKSNPKYHSFDILGARWDNFKQISNYSVSGTQTPLSGSSIEYNETSSGDHIKKFNYGSGLSQNLIDNVTPLINFMKIKSEDGSDFGTNVYGTYQHASKNISLTNSKSYTVDSTGLGGVIKHNYSKSYDGMQGVYTNPT